jgi:spore maturation protein CgeB
MANRQRRRRRRALLISGSLPEPNDREVSPFRIFNLKHRLELLRGRPRHEQARVVSHALLRGTGIERPRAAAALSPPSPLAPHLIRRPKLRVAGILDHFSHVAFQHEFVFESLLRQSWRAQLDHFQPQVLLVESAWAGAEASWEGRIAGFDQPAPELVDVVHWCRQRGVPAVFWNKEDPPNYLRFIASAQLFDHVFTVDADSLGRYRRDLGHGRVDVLPFAAQPMIHHPFCDSGFRDERPVAFAGVYYRQKYADRRRQMEVILDPARHFGLDIYTRVASQGPNRWPRKYRSHIVGTLPYAQMVETYKRYKVFLNVSSVVDSTTMCPRRVFELLATGTPVLSAPTRGIDELFGANAVAWSDSKERTRIELPRLLADDDDRARRRAAGVRAVLAEHTYGHRVETVLAEVTGSEAAPPSAVTLLAHVGRDDPLDAVVSAIRRLAGLPAVGRLVVGGPGAMRLEGRSFPPTADILSTATGDGWQVRAISTVTTTYLSRVGLDHHYGDTFFLDALAILDQTEAIAAGKGTFFRVAACGSRVEMVRAGQEFSEKCWLHPDSVVLQTAALRGLGFLAHWADALRQLRQFGRVVSTDRFGFIEGRSGAPASGMPTAGLRHALI